MKAVDSQHRSAKRRPAFGWLIAGTLVGALIGEWLAAAPYSSVLRGNRNGKQWYENNSVKVADRRIPFVLAGCLAGVVLGAVCEFIARHVSRIDAVVFFVGVAAFFTGMCLLE